VVDLVANNVERQNRTLSLQFTAPGGNLDQKTGKSKNSLKKKISFNKAF